jgi:Mrp family chromosome partitioning ATPase
MIGEETVMHTGFTHDWSFNGALEEPSLDDTQKVQQSLLPNVKIVLETQPAIEEEQPLVESQSTELQRIVNTPRPQPQSPVTPSKEPKAGTPKLTKSEITAAHVIQQNFRQLGISLFFAADASARSVGFTSSIKGEGKSLLSLLMAQVLAQDAIEPVTLVECNWEHPCLHKYFGIPETPGLAELLHGSCNEDEVRYQVEDNLTFIPAGDGPQDAVKLLKRMQQVGLRNCIASHNGLLVVDLPSILTTGYGVLAASLLESIILVTHAQTQPESMMTETYARIKDLPVRGVIINQIETHIPHWIQQIL